MNERSNLLKKEQREFIDDEMVAAYLGANPDFFTRHVELLDKLKFHLEERGTVSLVDIQLKKLRYKVADLEEEITRLMEIGSKNDKLFRLISKTQCSLLTATNLKEAQFAIDELCEGLNLSGSIRIFNPTVSEFSLAENDYIALKQARFGHSDKYLGRLKKSEADLFFKHCIELGSVALIPIGHSYNQGVLAFSSLDGGHFQPDMDTLFLEQLAKVISALLKGWTK